MSAKYRITFSIERFNPPHDDDFVEIGFGSSSAGNTIAEAAHDMASIIDNLLWETQPGMPDPDAAEPSDTEADHG